MVYLGDAIIPRTHVALSMLLSYITLKSLFLVITKFTVMFQIVIYVNLEIC